MSTPPSARPWRGWKHRAGMSIPRADLAMTAAGHPVQLTRGGQSRAVPPREPGDAGRGKCRRWRVPPGGHAQRCGMMKRGQPGFQEGTGPADGTSVSPETKGSQRCSEVAGDGRKAPLWLGWLSP